MQLAGKTNKKRPDRFLMHFPHAHRGNYFTSFRNGDWKLIYWYHPEKPSQPSFELYNLATDPFETTNLAESKKNILVSMIKQMAVQLESEGALYPEDANGNIIKPIIP
jgi:arylsulfatase A-like enzyme